MIKTAEEIEIEDKMFSQLYYEYMDEHSKEAWDEMFRIVLETAENIIKSRSKGHFIPDLEIKATEAACNCMKRINKEAQQHIYNLPKKVATLVYSYTSYPMYNKQTQLEEACCSYDQVVEDIMNKENE